jgi:hypothetical protein
LSRGICSADNLDENGGGYLSLKRRPAAKGMIVSIIDAHKLFAGLRRLLDRLRR